MLKHVVVAALIAVGSVSIVSANSTPTPPTGSHPLFTAISFSATLKDSRNGETVGTAVYKEAKVAPGVITQSLKVSVKGQAPEAEIRIEINHQLAGILKTDRQGQGSVELKAVGNPTGPQQVKLPLVRPGSVIVVGTSKGEF